MGAISAAISDEGSCQLCGCMLLVFSPSPPIVTRHQMDPCLTPELWGEAYSVHLVSGDQLQR